MKLLKILKTYRSPVPIKTPNIVFNFFISPFTDPRINVPPQISDREISIVQKFVRDNSSVSLLCPVQGFPVPSKR